MAWEPIAIVGRGCVLPDALDPDAFWRNVVQGRRSIGAVPAGRWRLSSALALGGGADRSWTDVGGYVRDFDKASGAGELDTTDPLTAWVHHAAGQALREAGWDRRPDRAGLVMGNLSFPSAGLARFAEGVWLAGQDTSAWPGVNLGAGADAAGRFSSGLPAHRAARLLGLGAGAFALDAACASALYAIKLGCDRLHDRSADLMIAGGVNCPDDLFIHIGFSALSALSRTGRSRPFHRDADGLVPAEGAAFVALMRLSDAVAEGARVFGVIRGIGLSNDGSAGGVLAPAEAGQRAAMVAAYAAAGLAPETVSLVECHATGTPVGDAVEARSMAAIFQDCAELPIGSVKSNVGHLITAAGAAGLLKVLGAMDAGILPVTLDADEPIDALAATPLRPLTEAREWSGQRRAAVSAFGFGGNNAHLIVDAWTGGDSAAVAPFVPAPAEPVAIVAIGAQVAAGRDTADFADGLFGGYPQDGPRATVDVALAGLKFPPVDLEQALAQQLLVLEAARDAVAGLRLPAERTMVLVGMGCDPEVARYGARWRAADWLRESAVDEETLAGFRDAFVAPLTASGVVGTMPNIVANRLNAQFDLTGPSFTVSAEEASGLVAVRIAARALGAGEADAAIVGAVDLSHEPVHQAALAALGHDRRPGDAAVVLVLKRLSDARRDGDEVIAILDDDATEPGLRVGDKAVPGELAAIDPSLLFGHPHAATGLLSVAAAALSLRHRAVPRIGRPADPALGIRTAEAVVTPLGAAEVRVRLRAAEPSGWVARTPPRARVFSGTDRQEVLAALAAGRVGDTGPARLVVLAAGEEEFTDRAVAAWRWLTDGGPQPNGVAFRAAPLGGEVGFVFAGGSMAYPGMGRELMLAFPDTVTAVENRCGLLREVAGWAYAGSDDGGDDVSPHVLDRIWGASLLGQVHAEITRTVLGIAPSAVLGYSSGEFNALSAMGLWTDTEALVHEARRSELFTRELVGEIAAARRVWRRQGVDGDRWASYLVSAEVQEVRAALESEPAVHLMMINAPDSCVIGGEATSCQRALARLGSRVALPIDYEIAVHAPEVAEVQDVWWRLHHRGVTALPGVRFYTGATADWYYPDADSAADALTGMALGTVDFAKMVERAWQDGVRVFIEHGPKALCTGWIRRTLVDREHLAVALDGSDGHDLLQLTRAVAELIAAGVRMDYARLFDRLASAAPRHRDPGRLLHRPAHPAAVRLPEPSAPPIAAPAQSAESVHYETMTPPVSPSSSRFVPPAPAADPVVVAAERATEARPARSASPHRLDQLHRDFLAGQAEIHQRFLATRQQAIEILLRARGAGRAAPTSGSAAPTTTVTLDPPPTIPAAPALDLAPSPARPALPGPKFDRGQLELLASGRISDLFGPLFRPQDGYPRQTRMPQPPMLLADRVTGIDGVPGSMGLGRIWTETDVEPGSWYLDGTGRMPAGLMIEAGQADLLLISWLGVDLLNRGERVYRLLGCELTYHGAPAAPGERLDFEISIDGHGEHDGVRLFFFHYDCHVDGELRMTVRKGQAGFFTAEELASSRGVLWNPDDDAPADDLVVDPPLVPGAPARFGQHQLRAFADGRPADCFGPGWERARAHVRSPRLGEGRMLMLAEVTEFDPAGGPWGRGYLRAEAPVRPDDWYFAGHFFTDPCMPGTLMFDGCLQAMSFYLAALGHTIERDGWRFEPVAGRAVPMRCRGQVTPDSRLVSYEVFVREVSAAPEPTLIADVLVTVDGLRAFHAGSVGLRLVPDWPLTHWRSLGPHTEQTTGALLPAEAMGGLVGYAEATPVPYDYASLLACAWGPPSEAFGERYRIFDSTRRVARLPGPPYHFMSRISSVHGPAFGMEIGSWVQAEYDVPDEVWYFEQNGHPVMPFAVLMEVVLQPCGWLASYVGSALGADTDLLFRNLDGDGVVTGEITPGTKVLRTRTTLKSVSRGGDMIIESFEVECFADDVSVFTLTTVFGYFPKEAFDDQVGLPPTTAELAWLTRPSDFSVDLGRHPAPYRAGSPRLAGDMLLMLDRVTGYWPSGGAAGLGRLRAEKDVDSGEWFFKAHFFQDPVQPGSLGVEAICQLLQFYLLERGQVAGPRRPRFEPVMLDQQVRWKYRGQVVPTNRRITVELEVLETGTDDRGRYAIAEAWLWADDKRIYHVPRIGQRIVADDPAVAAGVHEEVVDPAVDDWLLDHRPTWTVPALPMMSTVDRIASAAGAATGREVIGLRDVRLSRWITVPEPVWLRTEVTERGDDAQVRLLAWRDARTAELSRYEPTAGGTVIFGTPPAERPPLSRPLSDTEPVPDPYAAGSLFHGPCLRYLVSLAVGPTGSSGVLDAGRGGVPRGLLHQGLLDAATHVIPHDSLYRWSAEISPDLVGYPRRIVTLDRYESLPETGEIQVEARFAGFDGGDRLAPVFDLQLTTAGRLLLTMRLVDVLLPKGRLGSARPADRRAFLRDRVYADGVGLSTTEESGDTVLRAEDVASCDWLPGTVEHVYGLKQGTDADRRLAEIAVRDHVARLDRVHPSLVEVDDDMNSARCPTGAGRSHHLSIVRHPDQVVVRAREAQDLD